MIQVITWVKCGMRPMSLEPSAPTSLERHGLMRLGDDDGDWGGGGSGDEDEDEEEDDDDEDDDDDPSQSQGFFARLFSSVLRDMIGRLIGLAIAGVLILSCCCCGVGIAMFAPKGGDQKDKVVAQDKKPDLNPDAGPPIATFARGKVLLNEKARLTRSDPRDPVEKVRMKAYSVELQAKVKYVVSMNSKAFDAVVRLKDPKGKQVAEDDDGGGDLNARIVYTPTQSGTFRIIATTFHEGELGSFQLTVQEADATKKND